MKKLLLLSLIFSLFFIGCGNTNSNSNEKENEKEEVELISFKVVNNEFLKDFCGKEKDYIKSCIYLYSDFYTNELEEEFAHVAIDLPVSSKDIQFQAYPLDAPFDSSKVKIKSIENISKYYTEEIPSYKGTETATWAYIYYYYLEEIDTFGYSISVYPSFDISVSWYSYFDFLNKEVSDYYFNFLYDYYKAKYDFNNMFKENENFEYPFELYTIDKEYFQVITDIDKFLKWNEGMNWIAEDKFMEEYPNFDKDNCVLEIPASLRTYYINDEENLYPEYHCSFFDTGKAYMPLNNQLFWGYYEKDTEGNFLVNIDYDKACNLFLKVVFEYEGLETSAVIIL